ncbi:Uncharacterised protein [Serratia plymuthica]|uniref:Uncharacterized protein n=1 Tax=Serratia plymuthica TaxID=82996 RepID=A0A2X4VDW3_SERPL|nr:Uncharacterised protein [Serratia plymuthica]
MLNIRFTLLGSDNFYQQGYGNCWKSICMT